MNEQLTKYCSNYSERTAPNSIIASPQGITGGHLIIKLWVTGAARYIQVINSLGTSFTYFRIGNSGVVVIMDTFPVQGLRLLPSGARPQSNVTK